MILQAAIDEFRRIHGGRQPVEVVVTPEAALIVAAQEKLPPVQDGVKVRVEANPTLAKVEEGDRIALIPVRLPGDRMGVVATGAK